MENNLHVYAQGAWHDDVRIVGDLAGLMALRSAIEQAVVKGRGECEAMIPADGEGYRVRVDMTDEDKMLHLMLPYTEDIAQSGRGDEFNKPPDELFPE